MKKILIFTSIAMCYFALMGCASADKMVYKPQTIVQPKDHQLSQGITVGQVTIDKEAHQVVMSDVTPDDLKVTLKRSLRESNLYNESAKNKYVLNAAFKKMVQPLFGADLKVSCNVHYSLVDSRTNDLLYDKDVTSYYTAKFSDAFVGMERLKLANEGAVKANIEMLINDLEKLPA